MMDSMRVSPGAKPELAARSPQDTLGLESKEVARERRAELVDRIGALQERLFAEGSRSVLLVLQGLDGSGKDGVIRGVFTGINPQGCHVSSFRVPSSSRARARLPVARPCSAAAERGHRRLQPFPLRGRRRRATPPNRTRVGLEPQAGPHPRVGANARRRGHLARQGVPQRLEGRATGTHAGADRRSGASAGSSGRTISRSDVASTSTSRHGRTSSVRPRRSGRPGTSCPPTATG